MMGGSTGDWSFMIEEVLRLCEGEEVGFDVVPVVDTLVFAMWQGRSFLSYLNGTGILDGRVPAETLRRLIATPVPVTRESMDTALSCAAGGI